METPLEQLAEQFRRLPGIGIKTARKLAYHVVQQPEEKTNAFIAAIREAKEKCAFVPSVSIFRHLTPALFAQTCTATGRLFA